MTSVPVKVVNDSEFEEFSLHPAGRSSVRVTSDTVKRWIASHPHLTDNCMSLSIVADKVSLQTICESLDAVLTNNGIPQTERAWKNFENFACGTPTSCEGARTTRRSMSSGPPYSSALSYPSTAVRSTSARHKARQVRDILGADTNLQTVINQITMMDRDSGEQIIGLVRKAHSKASARTRATQKRSSKSRSSKSKCGTESCE